MEQLEAVEPVWMFDEARQMYDHLVKYIQEAMTPPRWLNSAPHEEYARWYRESMDATRDLRERAVYIRTTYTTRPPIIIAPRQPPTPDS